MPLTGAAHRIALEVLLDGPLSRAELARRVDLSPGSLTRLTKPLLDDGLLVEVDTPVADQRVGRPSQPLDVVAAAHHFVGIKLTGDTAHGVLTTLRAGVVAVAERRLPDHRPAAVADVVGELAEHLVGRAPAGVTAVGVSLGGHVAAASDVVRAPFLGWRDVPLADMVRARTGLPVVVANDVTALTEATHWFGEGRGAARFALVTIGAGVGLGLVVHDRLVTEDDASLGLIGHHPLDPAGPLCPLGHRGCAGAMLTIGSITAQVAVAHGRPVGYDEVLDLAVAGDPPAARVVEDAGRALGRLVAAAANFTMPERVVLGGEGVRLAEVARDALVAGMRADRDPEAALPDVALQSPAFTEWARGAAVIAIQTFVLGR
ncbi:MarR family transcriptional regulator [Cellulomonas pakistanensis]|uniref:MarR family transcriptional regulator n=1 Tax=Cellulomonas pakistanensis TaxID=992287 RepID=A0A919U6Z1_9CELL|nr:MarR family transcriptional regulator [Cellulomonas pakistanensis]